MGKRLTAGNQRVSGLILAITVQLQFWFIKTKIEPVNFTVKTLSLDQ